MDRMRKADGLGLDMLRDITDAHEADYVFEIFPTQAEAFKFADARPGLGLQVCTLRVCAATRLECVLQHA